ncbi:hypothetical protein SCA6_007164 [Theobroma cacao]
MVTALTHVMGTGGSDEQLSFTPSSVPLSQSAVKEEPDPPQPVQDQVCNSSGRKWKFRVSQVQCI